MHDFAREIQWVIPVVLDHLFPFPSTNYETLAPEQASRILGRITLPKYGSWLNVAEIEFFVLARERVDHRILSTRSFEREVAAYEQERNRMKVRCNWRFTNHDARRKAQQAFIHRTLTTRNPTLP